MRRQIAWVVVGMLSIGTTARAQEAFGPFGPPVGADPTALTTLTSPFPTTMQTCGGVTAVEVPYSQVQWNKLSVGDQLNACIEGRKALMPSYRVTTPLEQPIRSRKLVIAGVVSILGGIAMILPGGTTYHVLGDAFCVSDYSVDYGGCTSAAPALGAGLLIGGAAMAYFGSRPVTISPQISKTSVGASATIRWK